MSASTFDAAADRPDDLQPPAPTWCPGARPGGHYGALLGALVLSVVLAALVFSYGHLAVNAEQWPPTEVPDPGVARPLLGAIAVLVAAGAVLLARGGMLDDAGRRRLVPGLAISTVAGAVGTVVLWVEVASQPFAAESHSYAAAVFVLWGFALAVLCTCLAANAFVLACAARDKVGPEHEAMGYVVRTAWTFAALATVLVVAVIQAGARLL